jgi:sRNA-binding regulator protein Hfq
MIFTMEVTKEESRQDIEPQFLSQAQASGIKLHIGQMNKTEHDGIVRDIGRYEINLEEDGRIVPSRSIRPIKPRRSLRPASRISSRNSSTRP